MTRNDSPEPQWTDNVARKLKFEAEHSTTIEYLRGTGPIRYRATLPGHPAIESDDLGRLLDRLEALAAGSATGPVTITEDPATENRE